MRFLFSFLSLLVCSVSFSADIVGTWSVKNLSESMLEEKNLTELFAIIGDEYSSSEYKADFIFGVLGKAKQVKFTADGKFYCNDSAYGTYTIKNDELVLKRDKKLVDAFKTETKAVLSRMNKKLDKSDLEHFVNDSLVVSFSRGGNKALIEPNHSLDGLSLFPFAIGFVLVREGTDGASEVFNAGKSIVGRWTIPLLYGWSSFVYEFKEDGVLDILVKNSMDLPQKYTGSYSIKDDVITYTSEKGTATHGVFYIGKNCVMICYPESDTSLSYWREGIVAFP